MSSTQELRARCLKPGLEVEFKRKLDNAGLDVIGLQAVESTGVEAELARGASGAEGSGGGGELAVAGRAAEAAGAGAGEGGDGSIYGYAITFGNQGIPDTVSA